MASDLCKLAADSGLLNVETFAMLSDTIHAVKAALRTIIADNNRLGADAPVQELALTNLSVEDILNHAGPLCSSQSQDGGGPFQSPVKRSRRRLTRS